MSERKIIVSTIDDIRYVGKCGGKVLTTTGDCESSGRVGWWGQRYERIEVWGSSWGIEEDDPLELYDYDAWHRCFRVYCNPCAESLDFEAGEMLDERLFYALGERWGDLIGPYKTKADLKAALLASAGISEVSVNTGVVTVSSDYAIACEGDFTQDVPVWAGICYLDRAFIGSCESIGPYWGGEDWSV